MSSQLSLPQRASAPEPGEIAAYLLQQGWRLLHTTETWATFSRKLNAEQDKLSAEQEVSLEVPQRTAAPDYGRAVGMLVDDIAQLEHQTAQKILADVRASAADIIRLGIEGSSTRDGRIPVEAGYRAFEAARDMLLAAACSVIDPRQVYGKRKPDEAMSLLQRARFGQTEVGSFVLTMECIVPPRLQKILIDDGDPEAPFDRKTSVQLARALQAAEQAARESAAAGKIEPFRERTKDGVSANLCDAIAKIIDATSAENLRVDFSFASRRPISPNVPRRSNFSSESSAIFREASVQLRAEASYPATEIQGTVIKLDSINVAEGGDAVLRVDMDGTIRSVKISLPSGDYGAAVQGRVLDFV